MKKLRVLTNFEHKRTVTGIFLKYTGAVLLFLFLLPYVITAFFHNIGSSGAADGEMTAALVDGRAAESIYVENSTAAGFETIPLEIYLADRLSRTISREYEPEAIKTQAVLLRTALVERLWSETGGIRGRISLRDEGYGYGPAAEGYGYEPTDESDGHGSADGVFAAAAAATRGVFLVYGDEPAKAPYFAVSNGKTRNGTEVLAGGEYPYLPAVACDRDFLAPDYIGTRSLLKSEFTAAWDKAAGELAAGLIKTRVAGEANFIKAQEAGEVNLVKAQEAGEINLVKVQEAGEINLAKTPEAEEVNPAKALVVEEANLAEGLVMEEANLAEGLVMEEANLMEGSRMKEINLTESSAVKVPGLVEESAFLADMKIERDSSDYVVRITWRGATLSGEACRTVWGLDSACFQLKEEEGKIIFTVKGVGHGLGMSQFAANEMAKADADYLEILEYFFPGVQLTKIE